MEDTQETQEIQEIQTSSDIHNEPFLESEPPFKKLKKNKGGPRYDEVWDYFEKGTEINDGHRSAACYHCSKSWARGKPAKLKAHLANECIQCLEAISKFWRTKLALEKTTYTRPPKASISQQQTILEHFVSDKELPLAIVERINRSLLKAWVMSEIPFKVIENPFIIDLFKELNPEYISPSRTTLSERFLDQEVARVNLNIDKELTSADNLTLSKV